MRPTIRAIVALVLLSSCAGAARTARPPAENEASLVVMTYNVNFGIAGDEETLQAIRTGGADIVLLQETTPQWQTHLESLRGVYPHIAFHHCCGAGGLAVLSRYPVVESEVVDPPERGWFPAWRSVVRTPLGDVQTLNVHLRPPFSDSGSIVSGYFVTPAIRRAEIEKYVELLDDDLPAIVAGDFNENEDGRAMSFLESKGLTSALPEFEPSAETWGWNTSVGRIGARLDHIAYDDRLEPIAATVRPVGRSDHRPVVATFVRAR